ncbi:MAG: serine protease [Pseudomonadota bacterium]
MVVFPASLSARDTADPELHRSVGRLLVPAIRYHDGYARHYDEQCSAALIHEPGRDASPFILSAWHCIEHYRDLSRSLVFEAESGQRYAVRVLASGGGMHSDWALLRLPQALPGPLAVEAVADQQQSLKPILAGFPHDAGLTTESDCRITGHDGKDLRTDCVLRQGASGGAVIDRGTAPRYLGVISRGDGETQSIYVPVERFLARILPYMAVSD